LIGLWQQAEWFRWMTSWLESKLANHGRNPERSIYLGIGFVLLGSLVFRRRFMEVQPELGTDPAAPQRRRSDSSRPHYSSLNYSLGVFIPTMSTYTESHWRPRIRLVRWYRFLHQGLGWVMTGIILAAFTASLPK
jgi:hypothetical protein